MQVTGVATVKHDVQPQEVPEFSVLDQYSF
jgi:hypothetical protein